MNNIIIIADVETKKNDFSKAAFKIFQEHKSIYSNFDGNKNIIILKKLNGCERKAICPDKKSKAHTKNYASMRRTEHIGV
jgi:hypothetical protein